MIGDVVGKPGRKAVKQLLPGLRSEYGVSLAIANGENAAGGLGITFGTAQELLDCGVDVLTTGNHVWAQKEIIPFLDDDELPLLRPLNFAPSVPGRGVLSVGSIAVVNLIGRPFMGNYDCPFRAMDGLLEQLQSGIKSVVVDFHAEATSEKVAMGKYLDGRVSAVFGTHTHVGTSDACILPGGTAYVTDVGMVGPIDSVIGDNTESVIHGFLTQMPHRFSIGKGDAIFNAILVEVDKVSGKATYIQRIQKVVEE